MDKTVVSLMCENIRKLRVDVNEMTRINPDMTIRFIHGQYLEARRELSLSLAATDESQS